MNTLEEGPAGRYSLKWLLLPALVGLALIAYNIRWTASSSSDDHNAIPGVLSDIGVTLLLFSFLFLFERRMERRIIEGIKILTGKDLKERLAVEKGDPLMPGDFLDPFGPEEMAVAFVGMIEAEDYDGVWTLSDPNMRLCRAQAWIFNNIENLGLPKDYSQEWDDLAEYLCVGPHRGQALWDSFAQLEMEMLTESFADFTGGKAGWSRRRRVLGPRHELILLTKLPMGAPHGYMATGPVLLEDTRELLMVAVDNPSLSSGIMYLFAGFGRAAPLSGWPPTWWALDDPVACAAHPGLN